MLLNRHSELTFPVMSSVRVTTDGGANWNVIRKNADGQWIFDTPNALVDGIYPSRRGHGSGR